MISQAQEAPVEGERGDLRPVLLFWGGYLAITFFFGVVCRRLIPEPSTQLVWGFVSSGALLVLTLILVRREGSGTGDPGVVLRPASLGRFALGTLIGLASFGAHLLIVLAFSDGVHLEAEAGPMLAPAAFFFVRYLATSCMEELGFRGYALRRLGARLGLWPALAITSIAFGLSHLSYGWPIITIVFGVIPFGVLWGMSAMATRSLAVPIGLHAAWNFAAWSVGDKQDPGLFHLVTDPGFESNQVAGTASYLGLIAFLTLAFWVVHRRRVKRQS